MIEEEKSIEQIGQTRNVNRIHRAATKKTYWFDYCKFSAEKRIEVLQFSDAHFCLCILFSLIEFSKHFSKRFVLSVENCNMLSRKTNRTITVDNLIPNLLMF